MTWWYRPECDSWQGNSVYRFWDNDSSCRRAHRLLRHNFCLEHSVLPSVSPVQCSLYFCAERQFLHVIVLLRTDEIPLCLKRLALHTIECTGIVLHLCYAWVAIQARWMGALLGVGDGSGRTIRREAIWSMSFGILPSIMLIFECQQLLCLSVRPWWATVVSAWQTGASGIQRVSISSTYAGKNRFRRLQRPTHIAVFATMLTCSRLEQSCSFRLCPAMRWILQRIRGLAPNYYVWAKCQNCFRRPHNDKISKKYLDILLNVLWR